MKINYQKFDEQLILCEQDRALVKEILSKLADHYIAEGFIVTRSLNGTIEVIDGGTEFHYIPCSQGIKFRHIPNKKEDHYADIL